MNIEDIRLYCLSKNAVTEGFPFDDTTLVFKVMNKMFALLNLRNDHSINLKCDPEIAIALRERYPSVLPGYHMSKVHWNTVMLDNSIPEDLLKQWITDSYNLIVSGLSKKLQRELDTLDDSD